VPHELIDSYERDENGELFALPDMETAISDREKSFMDDGGTYLCVDPRKVNFFKEGGASIIILPCTHWMLP
jgi:hypothetical protein